jgi:hypothetical protein
MAHRLPSFLPRIAVLVLVALGATAGLTFAAGSQVPSAPAVPTVAATPPPPLIVPDVRNQAFVFAKGTLGDSGFAWRVAGSVRGYAANVVASQTPAAGTRIVDTGAPLITLTLKRNSSYPQSGEAADTSPYPGTVVQAADLAGNALGPAAPATQAPAAKAPAVKTPKTPKAAAAPAKTAAPVTTATATTAATPTESGAAAKSPQSRPVAFVVPGARKEPLDEMPLPDRAKALATWLDAHQVKSAASAKYWLYQNEWIVAGAKFGWWRGAEALQTLIAVDLRTQKLWGIGAKSAAAAQQALRDVQARAK